MQYLQDVLDAVARPILGEMGAPEETTLSWQRTRKDFEGELTLVTFGLTKALKLGPEQIGQQIGQAMVDASNDIESYNVVKGFLNLKMTDGYWLRFLTDVIQTKAFGHAKPGTAPLMMVEYASPNTNKPLHLGHLRNIFLGWSVSNILAARGHEVRRVQIINDRGIHICKSMLAWSKGQQETPDSSGIKGDTLVGKYYVEFGENLKKEVAELVASGIPEAEAEAQAPSMLAVREMLVKWEEQDAETHALWEKLNNWVYEGWDKTFNQMGVSFDKNYYESKTYLLGKDQVLKGLEKGVFEQEEDGSIWVDLTNEGMDRKILLRSDGTAVYMTQDIGTAIMRFEENPALAAQIYTVGNEQDYHFRVLFIILDKLGYTWAKDCHHLSYGMVELPKGMGKMKTREGTVVDADDLMDTMIQTAKEITQELGKLDGVSEEERERLYQVIGMGSLKYFLLKVDPKKKLIFDPKESIDFIGNTAPFIQYSHARIKSVLKKSNTPLGAVDQKLGLHDKERALIALIHDYPSLLDEAAKNYSPALVANYCFDLVKTFNQYYQAVPILTEDGDNAAINLRLSIISEVAGIVSDGMNLLGIEVPNQM